MKQYTDQIFARFKRIKKDFDSAYSYIIFDEKTSDVARNEFKDIIDLISTSHEGNIKYKLFSDTQEHRQLLVVKMSSSQKEKLLNIILLMSLSKDFNVFMYDPP
jgi:2,3-bisphosphoglycerate-independent phosphoglycerate mutase